MASVLSILSYVEDYFSGHFVNGSLALLRPLLFPSSYRNCSSCLNGSFVPPNLNTGLPMPTGLRLGLYVHHQPLQNMIDISNNQLDTDCKRNCVSSLTPVSLAGWPARPVSIWICLFRGSNDVYHQLSFAPSIVVRSSIFQVSNHALSLGQFSKN